MSVWGGKDPEQEGAVEGKGAAVSQGCSTLHPTRPPRARTHALGLSLLTATCLGCIARLVPP